jgi:hypothetical protein
MTPFQAPAEGQPDRKIADGASPNKRGILSKDELRALELGRKVEA